MTTLQEPQGRPAAPRTARVRVRLPIVFRIRLVMRRRSTGEIVSLDFLWTTRRRWERRSDQDTWTAYPIGPFVVAFGLD